MVCFLRAGHIYMCKKNVIERTRDLIYLKVVARDIFRKIISSSTGENSGEPDRSNYLPFCHTHLTPDENFSSLFGLDPLPSRSAGE